MDVWCEQQDFVEGAQDKGNKGPPAQDPNRKVGGIVGVWGRTKACAEMLR